MEITNTEIEKIKKEIDIVEYIGGIIELNKNSDNYFGLCPFHEENTASFSVSNEKQMFYCFGCGVGGDIINFVARYENISFNKAVLRIIQDNEIDVDLSKKASDTYEIIRKSKKNIITPNKIERVSLDRDVMKSYDNKPVVEWLNEGISEEILNLYQVKYDLKNNRIVFPIMSDSGEIISIKGRTLLENYKELGVRKYTYYNKIMRNDILFGLHIPRKLEEIKRKNEIIIFEGAKSVMKLDSLDILNSVAVATSCINKHQIDKIIGLKVNITIAFDKDKKLEDILKKNEIQKFRKFTNTYVIHDKNNLLKEKDSPIDNGLVVWNKLYESRVRI